MKDGTIIIYGIHGDIEIYQLGKWTKIINNV